MFFIFQKAVFGMALLRIISSCIEMTAALLMLKFNDVNKAIVLNSSLALVGPIILILTTAIGVIGIADKLSVSKIIWILVGVVCILYGVRSK